METAYSATQDSFLCSTSETAFFSAETTLRGTRPQLNKLIADFSLQLFYDILYKQIIWIFPASFVVFQTLSQIIKSWRWSYLVISVLLLNNWCGSTHIGCYYSDRVKLHLVIQVIVLKKEKRKIYRLGYLLPFHSQTNDWVKPRNQITSHYQNNQPLPHAA